MYVDYYKFRQKPFRMCPDHNFLYLSPVHREALAALTYSVTKLMGFVLLTGEVGTGKTLVSKAFLQRSSGKKLKAIYLFNPDLSFPELIQEMYQELELPGKPHDLTYAIKAIYKFLIDCYRHNWRVVLFVDEAQLMPVATLERLRILSNLETSSHKLLQIVLCGQPELNTLLARHDLRQLKQRIAVSANLEPLDRHESILYMKHRLKKVATSQIPAFEEKALERIAVHSKGIPRVINSVAERALMSGYASQERTISTRIVREVIRDIKKEDALAASDQGSGGGIFRKLAWRTTREKVQSVKRTGETSNTAGMGSPVAEVGGR